MLSALELENFKGIAARQRIDFAPITLLFGANSAGKSTILQSLLYLHELIERGDADVDRTALGGAVVELGGFARMVHRHDLLRSIVLRAEFPTPNSLERFGRGLGEIAFPNLDDAAKTAWIELTIRHRGALHREQLEHASDEVDGTTPPPLAPAFVGPLVDRVIIGVGDPVEPLVWLEAGHTLRDGEPLNARINMGHPLLGELALEVAKAWEEIAIPEASLYEQLESDGGGYGGGEGDGAGLGDGSGFGDGRRLPVFAVARVRMSALPPLSEPLRVIPHGSDDTPDRIAAVLQVRAFLEMVVLGTTAHLTEALADALYIGPLRTIPARGSLYERTTRFANWADGLAAWELLLADRLNLARETNRWLTKLGAGCQVVVQQLFEPKSSAETQANEHVDETVRRLLLRTQNSSLVLPAEVGAGISQVVPVIVAALVPDTTKLVAIEQPELHVHPALQARLGDLLIEASSSRAFVIETHSEHLILRLMRRIRETHERAGLGAESTRQDELRRRRNEAADGIGVESAHVAELIDALGEPSTLTPERLSVLYVESQEGGVRITRLRVGENGQFLDLWPKGFFDERFEELYGTP